MSDVTPNLNRIAFNVGHAHGLIVNILTRKELLIPTEIREDLEQMKQCLMTIAEEFYPKCSK